jgi:hypothetical protein
MRRLMLFDALPLGVVLFAIVGPIWHIPAACRSPVPSSGASIRPGSLCLLRPASTRRAQPLGLDPIE